MTINGLRHAKSAMYGPNCTCLRNLCLSNCRWRRYRQSLRSTSVTFLRGLRVRSSAIVRRHPHPDLPPQGGRGSATPSDEPARCSLVPIMVRLERPRWCDAEILGLLLRELGQLDTDLLQVQG